MLITDVFEIFRAIFNRYMLTKSSYAITISFRSSMPLMMCSPVKNFMSLLPEVVINILLFISHGPVSISLFHHQISSFILKMDIGIPGVFQQRFGAVSVHSFTETVTNREVSRFVSFLFFRFKKSQIGMRRI